MARDPSYDEILERRALLLATAERKRTEALSLMRIVVAAVGRELLGIPVQWVVKTLKRLPIARLPGLPPYLPGVIQLQGEPICVVDLAPLLGIREAQDKTMLIVVERQAQPLALLVDELQEIRDLVQLDVSTSYVPPRRAHPWPLTLTTKDLISVLDIEKLYEDARISPSREPAGTGWDHPMQQDSS